MPELQFRINLTEAEAALFEGRMTSITPLSMLEAEELRKAIHFMDDFGKLTQKAFSTLSQVLESHGDPEAQIRKTLAMLREPAMGNVQAVDRLRILLGRAVFVSVGSQDAGRN